MYFVPQTIKPGHWPGPNPKDGVSTIGKSNRLTSFVSKQGHEKHFSAANHNNQWFLKFLKRWNKILLSHMLLSIPLSPLHV